MPRTRADLLASYRGYLALQRDLSEHTVRAISSTSATS